LLEMQTARSKWQGSGGQDEGKVSEGTIGT